ncbi:putative zinc-type alcohol dehydrogenase-like protein [Paraburkholderia bannensis]|uniref:Putative zinc-type alcohol dehydrogenase-like protein n=1 Tax=Paraburkholderia bannensis TaxID=765414 RepID=A0A7W9U741_9BURK|nr:MULTISPECIES: NAD(P)-dependent alcohol dehydrogenase [Paraburkholderia]MBB3262204.1 putative zinc-type alcohol dehydrogenase-like protein [Paraburkholderia sp. WP4_3_2]MBB6107165.1 putative zinc-type alcohol dehydrogenase-like protein [Paraburkholderia bannensis]
MFAVNGYGMTSAKAPLKPISFNRRDPRPHDVAIDILYCGICHADVGLSRGEWGFATYPCVPGHEIVGIVTRVGDAVTKFKVGDRAGVGPLVDSCRTCAPCKEGFEQLCDAGFIPTYMGPDADFGHTYGGYSGAIVVDENYAVTVPASLDPARAAPLLCAGITAWAPLKRAGVGPGTTVGVIGVGGVGHMAIKLAKALGAKTVALTKSPGKVDDAKRLGADDVLVTTDPDAMAASRERFDLLLDTVSMPHDLDGYMALVKRQGELVMVGTPDQIEAKPLSFVFRQKRMSGSFIGGIHEVQELMNFCAAHDIGADIELVPIEQVNEAWRRMIAADVHYRFVIDMATLPKPSA